MMRIKITHSTINLAQVNLLVELRNLTLKSGNDVDEFLANRRGRGCLAMGTVI